MFKKKEKEKIPVRGFIFAQVWGRKFCCIREMGIERVARNASKAVKFESKAAEIRYEENIQNRPLSVEKEFVWDNSKPLEQPPFIADVIIQHNWQLFCAHPEDPIVPLVREFYTNMTNPDDDTVYIRGVQVPLSVEAINTIFSLGDPIDEHSEFVEDITKPELVIVLETVAIVGAEWNVSSQGAYTCLRSSLNPPAKVWYHFLKSRLLPTTHGKTVSKEHVSLLYSMLTGKSINVGRMIHREICACAARKSGALFFPSLITSMCRNTRAPYLVNEEKLHNTG
ncbi:hypothetical protein PanWU01x14_080440 [Parasponia andersonii]|uniref:Putative plant transposon protein domain-containing protein n=1 Tax=Parasponia andersonii TaxID=3476 RepID=A0A2P5DAQ2_PARAD|nr:hypothetical protein PanWU01x14_080440 [Parasponia andersonii]